MTITPANQPCHTEILAARRINPVQGSGLAARILQRAASFRLIGGDANNTGDGMPVPRENHVFAAFRLAHEIQQLGFGFADWNLHLASPRTIRSNWLNRGKLMVQICGPCQACGA
jgi:hypothetical protein